MIEKYFKEENIVLDFRETDYERGSFISGYYSTILKYEEKVLIYYQLYEYPFNVCYAISDDGGITFKKPKNNFILKNSLASNNFSAFIDTNSNAKTKFKAIGGSHVGKDHAFHKN